MHHTFKRGALLTIVSLILCLPVWAQSQEDSADLVVTADRREKSKTETAATVQIIESEEIEKSGAEDITVLLDSLAGVQLQSQGSASMTQVIMGGFGENGFGRVLVLLDGRVLNNPDMKGINWQAIDLASVERIEVLSGGGSVLYGGGAVGGVINIITKEAKDPLSYRLYSSYGSFTTYREAVSVALAGEKGSIDLNGDYAATEGDRERTGEKSAHASLSGTFYPTENLASGIDLSYAYSFYEMPGGITKAEFDADPDQAKNMKDESNEHSVSSSIWGEFYLNEATTLSLLFSYDFKNIQPDMVSYWGTSSDYNTRLYNSFQLQPKAQWSGSIAGYPTHLLGGLDGRYAHIDSSYYSEEKRENKISSSEAILNSGALYAKGDLSLSEHFALEAGARLDAAQISDGDDEKQHLGPAWSLALRYKPNDSARIYLKHEKVFRYPFTDEQISGTAILDELEAEKGYLFETGILWKPIGSATLEARSWLLFMEDEIAYVGSFPTGKNENYGTTRRIGAELNGSLQPIEEVALSASYAYLLPEFTNGADEGNIVPMVSQHEAEAGADFFLPFNLQLNTGISYKGKAFQGGDKANTGEKIDDYLLLSAGFSWKPELAGGELAISVRGENLLDKVYAPYVSYGGYYPARGRSLTLSGSFSY